MYKDPTTHHHHRLVWRAIPTKIQPCFLIKSISQPTRHTLTLASESDPRSILSKSQSKVMNFDSGINSSFQLAYNETEQNYAFLSLIRNQYHISVVNWYLNAGRQCTMGRNFEARKIQCILLVPNPQLQSMLRNSQMHIHYANN